MNAKSAVENAAVFRIFANFLIEKKTLKITIIMFFFSFSADTSCPDPVPTLDPLMRFVVGPKDNGEVSYPDDLVYTCSDERMLLARKDRPNDEEENFFLTVTAKCQWSKDYSVNIDDYECVSE